MNKDDNGMSPIKTSSTVDSDGDAELTPQPSQNTYFGISFKQEYGLTQFFALVLISSTTMAVGMYMTAQMTFLLENDFHISNQEKGQINSNLVTFSIPFTVFMTAIVSYAFEIIGRKWTLFLSFFMTSLVLIYIPYTSPSLTLLYACRCTIGLTMAAPVAHPLLVDWVEKQSRGKGLALMGIGTLLGNIYAMGILFNFTKDMNFKSAFLIAGLNIMIVSFVLLFMIKDPDLS